MQRPGGDVPCALCGGVEVDLSTLVPTEQYLLKFFLILTMIFFFSSNLEKTKCPYL